MQENKSQFIASLSEHGAEYREIMAARQKDSHTEPVFGEKLLRFLDEQNPIVRTRVGLTRHTEKDAIALSRTKEIKASRKILHGIVKEYPYLQYLLAKEIEADSRLFHAICATLQAPDTETMLHRLVSRFGSIPDSIYIDILRRHQIAFDEKRKSFGSLIATEWNDRIKTGLSKTLTSHGVPFDPVRFDRRINNAVLFLEDPFKLVQDLAWAYHQPYDNSTHVSLLEQSKFTRRIAAHETVHVLEGRSIALWNRMREIPVLMSPRKLKTLRVISPEVVLEKNGLVYIERSRQGDETSRYTWLNEAMTEIVSAEAADKEPITYEPERDLLDALLKRGKREIPLRLFLEAYFEDDDPGADPSARLRASRKLFAELSQSFYPGFLRDLDEFIWHRTDFRFAIVFGKETPIQKRRFKVKALEEALAVITRGTWKQWGKQKSALTFE